MLSLKTSCSTTSAVNPIRTFVAVKLQRILTTVVGILLILATVGCSSDNDPHERVIHVLSGPTMGTSYQVKVVAPANLNIDEVGLGIQSVLGRVNDLMSTYLPDSELSRFNQSPPEQWFELSPETYEVLSLGLEISEQSDGAFDMSVGPLVNIWGFGPQGMIEQQPLQAEIDQALSEIGYQHLQLRSESPAVQKAIPLYLDLSAIAKGYAVDQIAAYLDQYFDAYLVEVGGELKGKGQKPGAIDWKIAVESPQVGTREIQKVIKAENIAIATSGDYRNYFEEDGVRFSHTIDPTTGRPINHRLASVTILDPSCARADALATAMMVMGEKAGKRLAEELNIAAFFIVKTDNGFKEIYTSAFEPFLLQ